MFCRPCIHKAKLFVAIIAFALLIGHSQSNDDEDDQITEYNPGEKEKELLKKSKLNKLNFEVQNKILSVFHERASELAKIFGKISKVEIEKATSFNRLFPIMGHKQKAIKKKEQKEKKQYRENRDQMLADILHNLRSDITATLKLKDASPELSSSFGQFSLTALKEWSDLAKQQNENQHQVQPQKQRQENTFKLLFDSKLVQTIQIEINAILERMVNSRERKHWRDRIGIFFDNNDDQNPEIAVLNEQRIVYDSVLVQLFVIKTTFEAGIIIFEDKPGAVALVIHQKEVAQKLADTAKHMNAYVQGEEKILVHLEKALSSEEKLTGHTLGNEIKNVYNDADDYFHVIGFTEQHSLLLEVLAKDSIEAFARLIGKSEYVPAVDGTEVVLKYQLMKDITAQRYLTRAFCNYVQDRSNREAKRQSNLDWNYNNFMNEQGREVRTGTSLFSKEPSTHTKLDIEYRRQFGSDPQDYPYF